MRPAKEVKVSDLPLPERILHMMRATQEKQKVAHSTMNEDIVRRGFAATCYTPRVPVPSDKQLKAMPSDIKREVAALVERGSLVLQPFGGTPFYEVVEREE